MSLSLQLIPSGDGSPLDSILNPVGGGIGGVQDAVVDTPVGKVRFVLESCAAPPDLPNCRMWTLRLEEDGLPKGDAPWPYRWIRIQGLPLHRNTQAALANGYQCWSSSPMVGRQDVLNTEPFEQRRYYGDTLFYTYAQRPGVFHSWSFSYSCLEDGRSNPLFAAVDEDLFFTAFEFDLTHASLAIALDCEGARLATMRHPTQPGGSLILGRWILPDPRETAFAPLSDAVKSWMTLVRKHERIPRSFSTREQRQRSGRVQGYTSWYYRYNAIDAAWLRHNLEALAAEEWAVFQIDDGYQKQIGDWLTPSAGFPDGVKGISDAARNQGWRPGIWCAPFIVMENSALYRDHPDWVLKDGQNQPVLCGVHDLWGGRFFALDTEHPQVRAYVEQVLQTFFVDWGFKFLKADFLYAAARIPAGGLTRAQRSARAHQFLFATCVKHGAQFLSCGAVLSSAYGRCDYSRVGPDVYTAWENPWEGLAPSREKVSTRHCLTNTLTRAPLDAVMFGNDPDVFILRDNGCNLTPAEREMLARINARFGSLVFCSDDISEYGSWHKNQLDAVNKMMGGDAKGRKGIGSVVPLGNDHAAHGYRIQSVDGSEEWRVNLTEAELAGLPPHSYVRKP